MLIFNRNLNCCSGPLHLNQLKKDQDTELEPPDPGLNPPLTAVA